ncbi:VOC family protein [Agreia pratensis]|uniref:Catechol 2,3-dioxygenase n=1 Tax=Agreia pratensis TaxID=150121 RepID=A0A1X7J9G2_9MICO|nr:VOC family protein [Agreia pratensis]SMG23966.1 Catechol 2,3-dioxygenase [Agreia pratensis]
MTNSNTRTPQLGRFAPTLAVTDIDRSISFFREFLALEVHFTNGQPTGFAIVRNGPAELHLTLVKNHRGGSHNVAHLLVDDAAALYSTMDAAGVRMIKGLRDADYGLRGFVFCDPDGNRIDVGQSMP